jgi:hydrogenase maturation protease
VRSRRARLVIGVGNPDRGDDGAGREVARRLAARGDPRLEVLEASGEASSLIAAWSGFDDVVLVDACRGAGAPGSIHRLSPEDVERTATLECVSTHGFGVAAAVGLARAFHTLPGRLVVYAVEAGHARTGEGVSPEVERAVRTLVARLGRASHRPRLRHQARSHEAPGPLPAVRAC